jgi:hypothetical protein
MWLPRLRVSGGRNYTVHLSDVATRIFEHQMRKEGITQCTWVMYATRILEHQMRKEGITQCTWVMYATRIFEHQMNGKFDKPTFQGDPQGDHLEEIQCT